MISKHSAINPKVNNNKSKPIKGTIESFIALFDSSQVNCPQILNNTGTVHYLAPVK